MLPQRQIYQTSELSEAAISPNHGQLKTKDQIQADNPQDWSNPMEHSYHLDTAII